MIGSGQQPGRGHGRWATLAGWTMAFGLLSPSLAQAHLVSVRFGEFYSGLLHPVTALPHVVPWLALGLLGGLQSASTSRWVLVAFPLAVGSGVLAGGSWAPQDWIAAINLLSFVVLGLLVVAAIPLRKIGFVLVAVIFGITHGFANGNADLTGADQSLYMGGVMTAAYILVALVTAATYALTNRLSWGRTAARAAGSWIVAIGIIFGGFTAFAQAAV